MAMIARVAWPPVVLEAKDWLMWFREWAGKMHGLLRPALESVNSPPHDRPDLLSEVELPDVRVRGAR